MIRDRFLVLFLLVVVVAPGLGSAGCSPQSTSPTNVERTGGSGGAGAGGGGGRGGTGGASAGSAGNSGGSGGASAGSGGSSGGSGGSGGSIGGAGGGTSVDAPADSSGGTDGMGTGGSTAIDAPAADTSGGGDGGNAEAGGGILDRGEPVAGKSWLRLCPKAWNQTQCCQLLCECLPALCSDSPTDKARFGNCMSMCMGLSDFRARCQVYHCYESKNPGVPRDHVSHCGHASGRVPGGSCTVITNQK